MLTPIIPLATKGPRSSPPPQPTPNPEVGVGISIAGTYAPPPSPQQFAQWYGLIVIGKVVQILPAQWTTPDGRRPPGVREQDVPDTYMIITPVIIQLDEAPLVNRFGAEITSGRMVVATFGGQIGKDVFTIDDPSQHLQVGQHAIFGLTDHPLLRGTGQVRYSTPAGLSWNVGLVYTLTTDGEAIPGIPPVSQPIDAQSFIAAIVSAETEQP